MENVHLQIPQADPSNAKIIEVRGLRRVYRVGDVDVTALDQVSLLIQKGDFVAIMGPSGSGKTTFMNILGCLDRPTNGHYFLEGSDTRGLSADELADLRGRKIGFVFQGFNLLPRTTALENVQLPLLYTGSPTSIQREKALEALSLVGLYDRRNHHPNQLSGGQQQRVAIARALVNEAPMLLADEPTGNLDTRTGTEIMDLFVRLNKEMRITIVLVTHEKRVAAYSTRVIKFLDGRIIGDGPPESL